jgi:PilZ domain
MTSVLGVEQMTFEELVHTLALFEHDREPSDVDRAIQRSAVERRLMGILSAGRKVDERRLAVRVPGDVAVRLLVAGEELRAVVRDLGEGGVGLRSNLAPPEGATVEIELVPKKVQALVHPARAQALVAWVRPMGDHGYDLGLSFIGHDDAHRRRMRRLVLELLRRLPPPA